ncbi:TIGR02391 family protein [Pseudomonas sp. CR3202]|uniref:TIGR02391 family protein n=1 Tax=Pseudomonas sp. CR3202 TaxID=3351532 RepID=UPI003BF3F853
MLSRFIFRESGKAIQYLGTEYTQPCLEALRVLIQQRPQINLVRVLTEKSGSPVRHAFLITTETQELIFIRPGFTSGYQGEGPRGFASALLLMKSFDLHIEEHIVPSRVLDRILTATVTPQDLMDLQKSIAVLPTRLYEYIYNVGAHEALPTNTLRSFSPVIPFGIIDDRIADLAIHFFKDANAQLLTGYSRLESLIRNRTGLSGAGSKLFSAAFRGSPPLLGWPDIDPNEQAGRANLFVSVYQAYRNRRAHNEIIEDQKKELAELLLLNSLYLLERTAIRV